MVEYPKKSRGFESEGKKETCDRELKNTTLNVSTKYRIIKNKNIKT